MCVVLTSMPHNSIHEIDYNSKPILVNHSAVKNFKLCDNLSKKLSLWNPINVSSRLSWRCLSKMVPQKEVSQQCGEENSRQSIPLLETEEEPNTDKTETRRMGCSESVELTPRMRHWTGWVPTSPSAPDYPPLKWSFAIHPALSSVDSDSEL